MKPIITSILIISTVACNQSQPKQQESITSTAGNADSVKTFLLHQDTVTKDISLPGELVANEVVQVRAKVQGYIRKLSVDIGARVTKGQVLALVDAPEIKSRLSELNEKVKGTHARYQSSKDYFDRIDSASKGQGVIAQSEWQRTKNQMLADSAEYSAAVFAASSYKQIGDYLAIVAPYNGVITKRNIVIGSFVGTPNEKPLFELEDNSLLRLRVGVPEIYTNAILLDNSGTVTTRSLPDKKFKASLARKAGSIDNDTRSEIWEFEISNTTAELKPGSYADVKLKFTRPRPSFVVPVSAVVSTLEKRFVIKVAAGNTQWIDVRTGFNMGDRTEIFGDLLTGDTIVTKGNEELKAGKKVIVQVSK
ncbi:efflux RND transporter periplasmic adaptor subunit [Danxiaibacter flavus]|uniref:Efflux RND transporter periplasmic adaptor subunit n=1 Tax=Danxiaibacter flavus TaxID=3049108 RepID=A0ABV3ZIZ9_9BACT|nr:efflux RND transporter periplasmic adaptor subunit [Chitinophagaceae bacterium DXS]